MDDSLILTLKMDKKSQSFFDAKRNAFFPAERNFLEAHLMVFHHLPPTVDTVYFLQQLSFPKFTAEVKGLMKLGRGVAYRIESAELMQLHKVLSKHFFPVLKSQDRQGYRPHVTVQNKVTLKEAELLFEKLTEDFIGFTVGIEGIQVWTYLGGPWRREFEVDFN